MQCCLMEFTHCNVNIVMELAMKLQPLNLAMMTNTHLPSKINCHQGSDLKIDQAEAPPGGHIKV